MVRASLLLIGANVASSGGETMSVLQSTRTLDKALHSALEVDIKNADTTAEALSKSAASFKGLLQQFVSGVATPDSLPSVTALEEGITTLLDSVDSSTLLWHNNSQIAVNEAVARLYQCNTDKGNGFSETNGVDHYENLADHYRTEHASCRSNETSQHSNIESTCSDRDQYAAEAHAAAPALSTTDTSAAEMQRWFGLVSTLMDDYTETLNSKIDACDSATAEYQSTAPECDTSQSDFEGAFCEYQTTLHKVCETHGDCIGRERQAATTLYATTQSEEVSFKALWKVSQQARCFIDLLIIAAQGIHNGESSTVEQSDIDSCAAASPSTDNLDIAYQQIPAELTMSSDSFWFPVLAIDHSANGDGHNFGFNWIDGSMTGGGGINVSQCRGGEQIWTGPVYLWSFLDGQSGGSDSHGRRDDGSANTSQWQVGDVVTNGESCLDATFASDATCDVSPVASIPGEEAWAEAEYGGDGTSKGWLANALEAPLEQCMQPLTDDSNECPSTAGLANAATWLQANKGQTCNDACSDAGKVCDSTSQELQSRLCSAESLQHIIDHIGVEVTAQSKCRIAAGAPFDGASCVAGDGVHFCPPGSGDAAAYNSWAELLASSPSSCTGVVSGTCGVTAPFCACQ